MAAAMGMSPSPRPRIWWAFGRKPYQVQTWKLSGAYEGEVGAAAPYDSGMNLLLPDRALTVRNLDRSATRFFDVLGYYRTEPDPGNWTFSAAGNVAFMLGRGPDAIPAAELGDRGHVCRAGQPM
jgi:hypothetical protein